METEMGFCRKKENPNSVHGFEVDMREKQSKEKKKTQIAKWGATVWRERERERERERCRCLRDFESEADNIITVCVREGERGREGLVKDGGKFF